MTTSLPTNIHVGYRFLLNRTEVDMDRKGLVGFLNCVLICYQ